MVKDVQSEEEISEDVIDDAEKGQGEGDGNGDFLCAPCEDPEGIDEGVEIEAEVQKAARDPGQPTQAQREEHNLTHCHLLSNHFIPAHHCCFFAYSHQH